jgi:hypothetical protein
MTRRAKMRVFRVVFFGSRIGASAHRRNRLAMQASSVRVGRFAVSFPEISKKP